MREFIDAILQWPAILQGLLGSALFALISFVGERVLRRLGPLASKVSLESRKYRVLVDMARHAGFRKGVSTQVTILFAAMLVLEAMRFIVRALLMICLGLMTTDIVPTFGFVGYAMAVYYLLKAVAVTRDTPDEADHDAIYQTLSVELKEIKDKLGKSSPPGATSKD